MEPLCKKAKLSTSTHSCNKCGKSFAQKAGLSRHRRTTHTDAKWNCTICGITFGRKDNYQRHVKRHHQIGGGTGDQVNVNKQQTHQQSVDKEKTGEQPYTACNEQALGGTIRTHTIKAEGISEFDPMTFLRSQYDDVKDVVKHAIKERGGNQMVFGNENKIKPQKRRRSRKS